MISWRGLEEDEEDEEEVGADSVEIGPSWVCEFFRSKKRDPLENPPDDCFFSIDSFLNKLDSDEGAASCVGFYKMMLRCRRYGDINDEHTTEGLMGELTGATALLSDENPLASSDLRNMLLMSTKINPIFEWQKFWVRMIFIFSA